MRCFAIFEPETQAQIYNCLQRNITMLLERQKKSNILLRWRIWHSADKYEEASVKVMTQHMLDIGDRKLEDNDDTATVRHWRQSNWQPLTTQQLSDIDDTATGSLWRHSNCQTMTAHNWYRYWQQLAAFDNTATVRHWWHITGIDIDSN
jgi:hypothetical protein